MEPSSYRMLSVHTQPQTGERDAKLRRSNVAVL